MKKIRTDEVIYIQEDIILDALARQYSNLWSKISLAMKLKHNIIRTPKQCRDRWTNKVSVGSRQKFWKKAEVEFLFNAQAEYGNRWAFIASKLEGRSENQVKNRFYSTIRKNLRRFNKGKPFTQTIIFYTPKILENNEIRSILLSTGRHTKNYFANKSLSAEALVAINSQILESHTSPRNSSVEIEEFHQFSAVSNNWYE